MSPQRRGPARARDTRYEQIEAGGVEVQGQLQGAHGALLSDGAFEGGHLVRGLEGELVRIARIRQLLRGNLQVLNSHGNLS